MHQERRKRFQGVVEVDACLRAKIEEEADVDSVVPSAEASGSADSAEELLIAKELSDEELKEVVGGYSTYETIDLT